MHRLKSLLAALAIACAAHVLCRPADAALAIVQTAHGSQAAGTGVPGNVVLGSAPTVGNLVIVEFFTNPSSTTVTLNTASWQQIGYNINSDINFQGGFVLARYVQNGDTVTLPAMATAGSVKWAYSAWEVSGVTGDIEKDLQVVGAVGFQGTTSPLTSPSQTPQAANTLVLAAEANNFDTNPVSVPAGWTADINTGSQTNWGTLAGMHFANPTAGTPLSLTANAYGTGAVVQIVLQAAVPAYPYVEQEYTTSFNSSSAVLNTPVLLNKAPKVGNLIIGTALFPTTVTDPTVAAGWTEFARVTGGGSSSLVAMYRYAQGGDTASLLAFFTDVGAHFGWGYTVREIAGTTGVWAKDFQSVKTGQVTATSFTTTTDTTQQPSTLALVDAGMNFSSNATAPVPGSGWAFDGSAGNTFVIGTSKTFASKSTSVTQTATTPASGLITWMQVLLGAPASTCGGLLTVGVGC